MKEKCITYYFDSSTYDKNQILQDLQKECETQYFGKQAQIDISLNEFGTYIATLVFIPKENKVMGLIRNSIIKMRENKKKKQKKRYLMQTERKYGMYKSTGTFRPI